MFKRSHKPGDSVKLENSYIRASGMHCILITSQTFACTAHPNPCLPQPCWPRRSSATKDAAAVCVPYLMQLSAQKAFLPILLPSQCLFILQDSSVSSFREPPSPILSPKLWVHYNSAFPFSKICSHNDRWRLLSSLYLNREMRSDMTKCLEMWWSVEMHFKQFLTYRDQPQK